MVFSRICRACACEVNEAHEIENNSAKPELPLLLERYIPEFDTKIENACLCTDCVSILYVFHHFKRNSLRTEQAISLHIRKHPEVKAVNINDVFTPKEQANNTIDGIETTAETIKNEPVSDTELSSEATAITEEPIGKETEGTIEEETTEPPLETAEHICEFCFTVFPHRQSLQGHKKNCRKRIHYQCYECSRNFASKKVYDAHVAYHREPNAILYTCKICNFVYQSKHSLERHNISKHSSDDRKQFQCEACGKRFTEKAVLKQHMRKVCKCYSGDDLQDDPNQKPFKCEVCAKRFAQKATLTEHMLTHTKKELYICSICKYATAVITELDRHIREVHNIEAKTKLMCPLSNCRRVFFSEKSLEMHKRRFHRNKSERYQCDRCSREFALEKPYYEHLAYHKKSSAGRHTCKICNFVYHTRSSLYRHNIVQHMSDDRKPFQCKVCTMRFLEKTGITIHMRTHTGERPYKCPLCIYAATTKSSMYKHVSKIHTNIKVQFKGEQCVLLQ